MTEKVKLPQVVAEAIEKLRNAEYSNYGIVSELDSGRLPTSVNGVLAERGIIRDWAYDNDGANADRLLEALVNGWDIEPEHKVGNWIVFKDILGVSLVGKVEGFEEGGFIRTDIRAGGVSKQRFLVKSLRCATPEEIKAEQERRVWAGIGREVGEFRENDIIRDSEDEVFDITLGNTILADGLLSIPGAEAWHRSGEIKGIYPAESFISFEEGKRAKRECESNA